MILGGSHQLYMNLQVGLMQQRIRALLFYTVSSELVETLGWWHFLRDPQIAMRKETFSPFSSNSALG